MTSSPYSSPYPPSAPVPAIPSSDVVVAPDFHDKARNVALRAAAATHAGRQSTDEQVLATAIRYLAWLRSE